MDPIEAAQARLNGELLRVRNPLRDNLDSLIAAYVSAVSKSSFIAGAVHHGAEVASAADLFDAVVRELLAKPKAEPEEPARVVAFPGREPAAIVSSPAVRISGEITRAGSFEVESESNPPFRWVVEWQNSKTHDCRCPAFEREVNGLRTCRHVKAVQARIAEEWQEKRAQEDRERTAVS